MKLTAQIMELLESSPWRTWTATEIKAALMGVDASLVVSGNFRLFGEIVHRLVSLNKQLKVFRALRNLRFDMVTDFFWAPTVAAVEAFHVYLDQVENDYDSQTDEMNSALAAWLFASALSEAPEVEGAHEMLIRADQVLHIRARGIAPALLVDGKAYQTDWATAASGEVKEDEPV